MSETTLSVQRRAGAGKGVARKLRATGRIPGVLYGRGKPTTPISLDPQALERAIQKSESGVNTLFELAVQDDRELSGRVVLLKELQREPVLGQLIHADLYEVDLTRTVEVQVPIHIAGIPRGVSLDGGILDHSLRELTVECLPRAIPDEITVDVSDLGIGDSLHVRDLALPAGVELRMDPDLSVVSVVAPQKEEVVAPVEAAAVPLEGAVPAEGEAAPSEAEPEEE